MYVRWKNKQYNITIRADKIILNNTINQINPQVFDTPTLTILAQELYILDGKLSDLIRTHYTQARWPLHVTRTKLLECINEVGNRP